MKKGSTPAEPTDGVVAKNGDLMVKLTTLYTGTEVLKGGDTAPINWQALSPRGFGVAPVRIEYSMDGGALWASILEGMPNEGTYEWSVPLIDCTACRIRITATDMAGNLVSVASPLNFRIDSTAPALTVQNPTGGMNLAGGTIVPINWTASDDNFSQQAISIEASSNSGATWSAVASDLPNTGTYAWTVPAVDSSTYRIRVIATDLVGHETITALASDFSIDGTAPAVALTSLTGGQVISGGAAFNITWTASDSNLGVNPIRIEVSSDGGSTWSNIVAATANDGTESWTAPAVDSAAYRIRVTATDTAGRSSTASSASNFSIDSTAPSLSLTSLTGGQSLTAGTAVNLTWTATDANFSGTPIHLEVSSNSGGAWSDIAAAVGNSGSYSWTVPNVSSSTYRVRVTATDRASRATVSASTSDFSITNNPGTISLTSLTGGQVIKGATAVNITWTTGSLGVLGANPITLDYSSNSGGAWTQIGSATANDGTESWTPPAGNAATYRVRVTLTDVGGNAVTSASSADFTIDSTAPTLNLTSLTGGQVIAGNANYNLAFSASDANFGASPIHIEVSSNSGSSWSDIAAATGNSSPYSWAVPNVTSSTYRVRLTATDQAGNTSTAASTSDFAIDVTAPSVSLTSLTGGQVIQGGQTVDITWTATDTNFGTNPIHIEFSSNGGGAWSDIVAATANDGTHTWTAPAVDSATYRVRVTATDAAGLNASSASASNFVIDNTVPSLSLTYPTGGENLLSGGSTNITWTASDANFGSNPIHIEYSANAGSTWSDVAAATANDGTEAWTVPATTAQGRIRITATDGAGRTAQATSTNFSIVNAATPIYRSVGPGSTSALASGGSNALTISGGTATFGSALPANIGVGDAIQYDTNGAGGVDAIAFIHGRTSATVYTVRNAAGAIPTNSTAATQTWNVFRAYTSLTKAEDGIENTGIAAALRDFDSWTGGKNIVTSNEQWNIACYGDATDVDDVYVSNWTTAAQQYIRIYTPTLPSEVGVSQRHNGVWDPSKYNLEVSSYAQQNQLAIEVSYVRIEGLQIFNNNPGSGGYSNAISILLSPTDIRISDSIIRGLRNSPAGNDHNGVVFFNTGSNPSAKAYLWNNIIYDHSHIGINDSLNAAASSIYVYNNTLYNCGDYGIYAGNRALYAKNNIVQDCGTNFSASNMHASSNYNVSSANDAPGANSKNNVRVTFNDLPNRDLRLHPADAIARISGTDLSADANLPFNWDVQGSTRTGTWDIGADATVSTAPRVTYRSVAPYATAALATGASNAMTITGSIATFASALPLNAGVGDVIKYGANLAVIQARYSSTAYSVVTTAGAAPTAASGDTSWSLYRAYTSLSNAEAGAENTSIGVNFDTFTNGNDIVATNEIWQIATYANNTHSDNPMTINQWTTGPANYLRIFAPMQSTEVGVSQRHSGVWDPSKYNIRWSSGDPNGNQDVIEILDQYVRIDGLQLWDDQNAVAGGVLETGGGLASTPSEIWVTNSILRGTPGGSLAQQGFFVWASSADSQLVLRFYNNLIYDIHDDCFRDNDSITASTAGMMYYIYNNTAVNCGGMAFRSTTSSTRPVELINNIAAESVVGYQFPNTVSARSTNNLSNQSDAVGSNPQNGKTVTFNDPANGDYRLHPADAVARSMGAALTPPFNDDIQGGLRSGNSVDIGADSVASVAPRVIYRSVGPGNVAVLTTGVANAVTVAGSVATFANALPGTVGVGDVLYYDSNNDGVRETVAFVQAVITTRILTVVTATGGAPAAASADTDWRIYRAYTSMAEAETGSENSGIGVNFDTWSLGKNLVSANQVWNVAVYADGTDTTAFSIAGWTTGSSNYLRFFAPANRYEAGASQRHAGVWDAAKARWKLGDNVADTVGIRVGADFVRFEGLQFFADNDLASTALFYLSNAIGNGADIRFNANIIRGRTTTANGSTFFGFDSDQINTSMKLSLWNNMWDPLESTCRHASLSIL